MKFNDNKFKLAMPLSKFNLFIPSGDNDMTAIFQMSYLIWGI